MDINVSSTPRMHHWQDNEIREPMLFIIIKKLQSSSESEAWKSLIGFEK